MSTAAKSITNLLTKVRATADQRAAAAADAYKSLVAKCARGAEVDPDQILKSLAGWGRDPAEFQADVERMERRLELRNKADTLPDLRGKNADIDTRAAAAAAEFEREIEAASAKRAAVFVKLTAEREPVVAAISIAEAAERALGNTARRCPFWAAGSAWPSWSARQPSPGLWRCSRPSVYSPAAWPS